jgi:hypothetical protein
VSKNMRHGALKGMLSARIYNRRASVLQRSLQEIAAGLLRDAYDPGRRARPENREGTDESRKAPVIATKRPGCLESKRQREPRSWKRLIGGHAAPLVR